MILEVSTAIALVLTIAIFIRYMLCLFDIRDSALIGMDIDRQKNVKLHYLIAYSYKTKAFLIKEILLRFYPNLTEIYSALK